MGYKVRITEGAHAGEYLCQSLPVGNYYLAANDFHNRARFDFAHAAKSQFAGILAMWKIDAQFEVIAEAWRDGKHYVGEEAEAILFPAKHRL